MLWQRQLISSRRRFTTRALCLSTPRRLNGVAVNSTYATVVAGSNSNSRSCTTVFTAAAKSAPEKNNRQNYSKKAFFSSFAASFALLPRAAHQQCLIAPPPPPASLFSGQSLISYISSRNKSTSGPKKPSDSNSLGSKRQLPTPACNKIVERNLKDQQQATGKMASSSKIRQNYNEISEAAVNKQINLELYASYFYQQLAFHFNRDDVALPGFEKFFAAASKEEREHAEKLMKYQNQRGGRIVLQDIPKPIKQSWSSGLEAMEAALELEKTVNQSLLDLHSIASKHDDPQFADFLESHYLTEQVEAIKKLSDCVTNLRRVGSGLGEYLFDKETLLKS